jgi:hypothetical protein
MLGAHQIEEPEGLAGQPVQVQVLFPALFEIKGHRSEGSDLPDGAP